MVPGFEDDAGEKKPVVNRSLFSSAGVSAGR
jgi:hypothetical protein